MDALQAWILAVGAFADVVDRLPPDGWDQPALGDWCLRDLVGHTCSAGISAVVAAVEDPREKEDICSSEGYYALAKTVDPAVYQAAVAASTDDARRTGAELGVHPADAVRRLVDQAEAKLAGARGDLIVDTAGGGMRLSVWLPTRTFELVVHHLDIAAATGIPTNLPDAVVADCAALAARIASAVGDGPSVLLALTGRAAAGDFLSRIVWLVAVRQQVGPGRGERQAAQLRHGLRRSAGGFTHRSAMIHLLYVVPA